MTLTLTLDTAPHLLAALRTMMSYDYKQHVNTRNLGQIYVNLQERPADTTVPLLVQHVQRHPGEGSGSRLLQEDKY